MPAIFKPIPTLSQETRTPIDTDGDGIPDRFEVDTDGDGNTDRIEFDPDQDGNIDRIEAYIHDDDGNRTRTRFDDDADGNFDRSEFDFDADGNIDQTRFDDDDDGTNDRIEFYTYNSDGGLIRTRFDDDADGTTDRSERYTLNEGGNRIIRTDFDDDADGTIDRSEAYIYNGDGNRTRTRFDDDNDGTIDRIAFDNDSDGTPDRINHYAIDDDGTSRVIRTDFDLDDDGNIDRIAHLNADGRWERVELDADDDGNIDRIDHYSFAADGTRSLTRTDFDTDGDGTTDRSERYTLNEGGNRIIRTDFDDDADGTIDRSEAYIYNGDGNRTRTRFDDDNDGTIDRIAFDNDGDGTPDRINHYAIDDDGTGRVIRTDFDLDDDGNIDRTVHLNADGRWERVELDADDDGIIDRINHYVIDDDGTGRVIRRDSDLDDDGNIDRTVHLNADGRWERVELDADDDGNIDRIDHYSFAADGTRSLTRTDFDTDGDGTTDRSEAYIYDGDGNRIRTRFDDDNDGNIDRIAFDDDGDGTPDRINHYAIDDDGTVRVIRRDSDLDDDGNIDRIAHLNADGRWERVELDADDDGTIDRIDHYSFAADGTRSLTRTDFDDDGDGTADRSEAYIYDGDGNRIRTRFDDDNDGNIDRIAFDDDGDGTPDRINHYAIDDDGTVRVIRRDSDLDDDGTIDRTVHLNADGRWERVELDADDDGNIDRIDHYTFAVDGTRSLTRSAFDDDADGTADRSEAYTYNSGGTLIRTAFDDDNDGTIDRTAFDSDGDGTADRIDHYTYDDYGARRMIRRDFDDDDDGTINRTAHLNAEGRWERVDLDADDDGNIDRSNHYTFAADGAQSLTRTAFDTDGDGTADRIDHYTYDDDGARRVIRRDFDLDGDGNPERIQHLDADGRLVRLESDDLDDGTPNQVEYYWYPEDLDGARDEFRQDEDTDGDGELDRVTYGGNVDFAGEFPNHVGLEVVRMGFVGGGDGSTTLTIPDNFVFAGNPSGNQVRIEGGNTDTLNFDMDDFTEGDRSDVNGESYRSFTANDGSWSFLADVRLNAPVFTSPATANAQENQIAAYEAAAADAYGDPLSYSLSGTDAALFTIDANTGVVSFRAAPDFEVPGDDDGDNVYDIIVTASDGTTDTEQAVAITVTNDNDNVPTFTSPATANAQENQTAAYEAATTDADGDTLVYSLSGTDAALFTIDANTGEVSFIAAPDFEAPSDDGGDNVYDIIVTASDGTNRTDHNVAITVTNENDNIPVFTSSAAVSARENQTAAYMAAATDADGDTLVYSLSGTDAALFTIDANTGEVSFRAAPDFEAPGDDDGDNVYDIIVTASDGTNSTNHNVTITVTNDNDNIPVFTSPATANAQENQTAAYEASATDADGDTLVYSLSGTDSALFTIDANTGEVSFITAPDFEAPGDDDGDNVYDIIVTASDGTNSTDHNVAITVTNENDNVPAFTSPATVSVAENRVAAYEAAAADADDGPLSYSLSGTDAALFTIDANTGEVSFMAAPDFEAPGDDGGDNVYDIIVTASDGTNQTDQSVAITVTDEYDLIPLPSLNGSNGFILNGIDVNDRSGRSVSSAGDVNGDGYDDLIIGAPGADPDGGNYAGETYVIYGGANTPGTDGVLDLSVLDGTNGFILNGISELDDSGSSVSSAGDVNGDGYDDLIIGALGVGSVEGEYVRFPGPGEAYVVYGGATGADLVLDRSTLDGTRGFALTGIDDGDKLGLSVSSAGDVNGDGYDDLIISANEASPNGDSDAGETYVVYGGASAPGTDGVLDLGALNDTNGFTLTGIAAGDQSGRSVSAAGDVNGDGYDDLIIGAFAADPNGDINAGEIYLVYGGANSPGTDGVLDLSDLDGTNGFILTGIDANDRSGFSVSSAGDVNGDGYDDLIIGAYGGDPNGDSNAGETYVVYGGASAPGTGGRFNLSALDGTNGFILNGIDADDLSGWAVSSAGDVNGDGYDDLIIGAYGGDPNGDSLAGETYIVFGEASAPGTGGVLDLGALDGTNGFILTGVDAYDNSGFSVSSAGDVNGDGYDDLIIGAYRADPDGDTNAGETYVIYGGATRTESLVPVTASGTAAADNFTGNAGADSFTAIATDDVVRGGAGNDNISVTALDFAAIDGGTGQDTLVLAGAGLTLDLTGPGNAGVDSVEVFDLSGTGANSLVLDALAVFDVTEEREGGVASLDVLGDADDRVDLSGSSFALTGTAAEDGVTYNVYRDGNAQLRIEDGVSVTLAATGSQSARSKTDTKTDPKIAPKTDTGINPVAETRTDPGLDDALMNNDLWDDLWADGIKSLDQPVHIDEDAILTPLSDPLSFGPLASGPLPGPWGNLIYWPGLGNHPAMQNDLAMILPEMEIVTADMEGF